MTVTVSGDSVRRLGVRSDGDDEEIHAWSRRFDIHVSIVGDPSSSHSIYRPSA